MWRPEILGLVQILTGVSVSIAHLVSMKIISPSSMEIMGRRFPAVGHGTSVAMIHVIAVVYVTVEASRAVEPRTGSNEDAAAKPLRTIVSVRGASIWSVIVVAIGTYRCNSDTDGNLGMARRRNAQEKPSSQSKREIFQSAHKSPLNFWMSGECEKLRKEASGAGFDSMYLSQVI